MIKKLAFSLLLLTAGVQLFSADDKSKLELEQRVRQFLDVSFASEKATSAITDLVSPASAADFASSVSSPTTSLFVASPVHERLARALALLHIANSGANQAAAALLATVASAKETSAAALENEPDSQNGSPELTVSSPVPATSPVQLTLRLRPSSRQQSGSNTPSNHSPKGHSASAGASAAAAAASTYAQPAAHRNKTDNRFSKSVSGKDLPLAGVNASHHSSPGSSPHSPLGDGRRRSSVPDASCPARPVDPTVGVLFDATVSSAFANVRSRAFSVASAPHPRSVGSLVPAVLAPQVGVAPQVAAALQQHEQEKIEKSKHAGSSSSLLSILSDVPVQRRRQRGASVPDISSGASAAAVAASGSTLSLTISGSHTPVASGAQSPSSQVTPPRSGMTGMTPSTPGGSPHRLYNRAAKGGSSPARPAQVRPIVHYHSAGAIAGIPFSEYVVPVAAASAASTITSHASSSASSLVAPNIAGVPLSGALPASVYVGIISRVITPALPASVTASPAQATSTVHNFGPAVANNISEEPGLHG